MLHVVVVVVTALVMALVMAFVRGRLDSTSGRPKRQAWWRIPCVLLVLGGALWLADASALLWTSALYPGRVGLIDAVLHGGAPAWLLSIPLVALLIALLSMLPAAGRFGLVFCLQFALFWLVLAGLVTFLADGRSPLDSPAMLSFLAILPATLVVIPLALTDTPPLDSPFAPVTMMFAGRTHHLRGLLSSAQRFGWEVTGPAGVARALMVGGYFGGGRSVRIVSGVSWYGVWALDQGYWYKVTVTSPHALPAFQIARQKRPSALAVRGVTGALGGGRRLVRWAVFPRHGVRISDEWQRRFMQQVASGERFLRTRRQRVQLAPGGLLYTHFSMMRLPAASGEIEPLVDWLIDLAALLEELAPPAEQIIAASEEHDARKLPYGQISDVDPTSQTW